MRLFRYELVLGLVLAWVSGWARVELGVDCLFREEGFQSLLKGRCVGLVTNQTGVDGNLTSTIALFRESKLFTLKALYAPEHGIDGKGYAGEKVGNSKGPGDVPIYSLHGKTRRPTEEMLSGIDVLVFDIQDVGVRAYTYLTTLCYVMEEAAKRKIGVVVLDRPNPLGGSVVDGPMLQEKWRSYIGYLNVPYCHGMTVGELARFFNAEYKIGCRLRVVPMKGWKRSMTFKETGLNWVPTSPQVPEADTPFYMASTGILGELGIVSIGIGYTLPFKVVGAPWIEAEQFAAKLTEQKLPGVKFVPFHFRPFYGVYKGKDCEGVRLVITDAAIYRPLSAQYLLIGVLKSLYPTEVSKRFKSLKEEKKDLFCKANGNDKMWRWLFKEKYIAWKFIGFQKKEREDFLERRKKYLLYD